MTQLYYLDNGTYELWKWHDAAAFNEDPNWPGNKSAVYAEKNWFDEDDCGNNFTVIQGRRTGDVWSGLVPSDGAQDDVTSYFGSYYGRLSGQTYERWNDIGRDDAYDYQFGQWNAASNTFTLSGATNDLRQIIYHGFWSWNLSGDAGDVLTVGESGIDTADV